MQIDNVLEQLEADGHYDLAAFLVSYFEGLKREVETYRTQRDAANELLDRVADQLLPHNPMYRVVQDFLNGNIS